LQELDALLQQMLALPILESEAETVPNGPAPAAREPETNDRAAAPAPPPPAPKRPDPLTSLLDTASGRRGRSRSAEVSNPAVKKLQGLERSREVPRGAEVRAAPTPAPPEPKRLVPLDAAPAVDPTQPVRAKALLTLAPEALADEDAQGPQAPVAAPAAPEPPRTPRTTRTPSRAETGEATRARTGTDPRGGKSAAPRPAEPPVPPPSPRAPEEEEEEVLDPALFDLSGPETFDLAAPGELPEDPFDLPPPPGTREVGMPDAPAENPSLGHRTLVGINTAFDRGVSCLGPLGRLLTTPVGRQVLGWLGILLLSAAGFWVLADWRGWFR
jgi:hypothetical protein